jgi:amidase
VETVLALSATEQAAWIRDGRVSSEELVQVHLRRIAEINPALNAVVAGLDASALAEARAADAARARMGFRSA